MKEIKRYCCFLLAVVLFFLFTGCNAIGIDVEGHLRPPKNNGEQEALQNALETYIQNQSTKGDVVSYSLKYPTQGQYLSAFVLLDQVKDHTVLSPQGGQNNSRAKTETMPSNKYGIAFYRMDVENAKTHINLLQKNKEGWASIADVEGFGEEIAQVEFAELNGTGLPELIVGWNMFNTKDKRLTVYSLDKNLESVSVEETYTSLVVNDLTANGKDDLLLLNILSTGQAVTARMVSWVNGTLEFKGQAFLDNRLQRFGDALVASLSPTVNGVFLDAHKDPDTVITELIYWEDGQLHAPFCSDEELLTTVTAREIPLSCQDIDQDGVVEMPIGTRLPGYEETEPESTFWETKWFSYDHSIGELVEEFSSIVNLQDSYMLKTASIWPKEFTVRYDSELRILEWISTVGEEVDDEVVFLKIQVTTSGKKSDLEDDFVYFDKNGSLHYAVWLDENSTYAISMEELRYLFATI